MDEGITTSEEKMGLPEIRSPDGKPIEIDPTTGLPTGPVVIDGSFSGMPGINFHNTIVENFSVPGEDGNVTLYQDISGMDLGGPTVILNAGKVTYHNESVSGRNYDSTPDPTRDAKTSEEARFEDEATTWESSLAKSAMSSVNEIANDSNKWWFKGAYADFEDDVIRNHGSRVAQFNGLDLDAISSSAPVELRETMGRLKPLERLWAVQVMCGRAIVQGNMTTEEAEFVTRIRKHLQGVMTRASRPELGSDKEMLRIYNATENFVAAAHKFKEEETRLQEAQVAKPATDISKQLERERNARIAERLFGNNPFAQPKRK